MTKNSHTQIYKQWQCKTKEVRDEVISICGGETFQKWDRLTDCFVEFLEGGCIGGARFVAQKSS